MIGIVSNSPIELNLIEDIWQNIKMMANDQTIIHENNREKVGDYKHKHGWGVAYLKNNELAFHHSDIPIYEDNIDKLKQQLCLSNVVIFHARKASPNIPVGFDYIHPFIGESTIYGKVAFAHNGTISNPSEIEVSDAYELQTKSDTERYLNFLLLKIDGNSDNDLFEKYTSTIREFKQQANYSGINSLMLINNHLFILNEFAKTPKYLTMHYAEIKDRQTIIVSSEPIDKISSDWKELGSGKLLNIPLDNILERSIIEI